MKEKIRFVAHSAMIAALYVVLTYLANLLGIASGVIQVRFSEALTILPYFTSAAIPGLYIGCLLANFLTGAAVWDIIFGSLATLIGAVFTYLLRKKNETLAPVPPILANTLIIPPILKLVYGQIQEWHRVRYFVYKLEYRRDDQCICQYRRDRSKLFILFP